MLSGPSDWVTLTAVALEQVKMTPIETSSASFSVDSEGTTLLIRILLSWRKNYSSNRSLLHSPEQIPYQYNDTFEVATSDDQESDRDHSPVIFKQFFSRPSIQLPVNPVLPNSR